MLLKWLISAYDVFWRPQLKIVDDVPKYMNYHEDNSKCTTWEKSDKKFYYKGSSGDFIRISSDVYVKTVQYIRNKHVKDTVNGIIMYPENIYILDGNTYVKCSAALKITEF